MHTIKLLVTLGLAACATLSLVAQDVTLPERKRVVHREWGTDLVPLSTRLFSGAPLNASDFDPMVMLYRRQRADGRTLRLRFGANASVGNANLGSDDSQPTQVRLLFGIGREQRRWTIGKAIPYIGWEAFFDLEHTEGETSFSGLVTRDWQIGVNAIYGCQLKLNERLRISTEGNAGLVVRQLTSGSPGSVNRFEEAGVRLGMTPPLSLIVSISY